MTGLGRYLLAAGQVEPLREVLARLVALTVTERAVPGWWAPFAPTTVSTGFVSGHANAGMAHGISGSLALLSLASRAGLAVPGQVEAIEAITGWLIGLVGKDEHDEFWPHHTAEEDAPTRPAWCCGSLGVARAVQLAGEALEDHSLGALAVRVTRSVVKRPRETVDASLCHGAAGLHRREHGPRENRAGMLEGAAGIESGQVERGAVGRGPAAELTGTRHTPGMKFRATVLLSGKTATGVEVPNDVVDALASGRKPAVRARIGDYEYRTSVGSMGGRFMLPISAEVRAGAGVSAGDDIEVELTLDTEVREITVPDDLAEAMDTTARKKFDALSYSAKRRLVTPVDDAKTPETRQRRIAKVVEGLQS